MPELITTPLELDPLPVTELNYWEAIEYLGGMRWHLNHRLADGRLHDPNHQIAIDINRIAELQTKLVAELEQKFGVIFSQTVSAREQHDGTVAPPEGKRWYWPWYDEMKRQSRQKEYEQLICSACPMSEGVDRFVGLGLIPCGAIHGVVYNLRQPFSCAMIDCRLWNRTELEAAIRTKAGRGGLRKFRKHEQKLLKLLAEAKPTGS